MDMKCLVRRYVGIALIIFTVGFIIWFIGYIPQLGADAVKCTPLIVVLPPILWKFSVWCFTSKDDAWEWIWSWFPAAFGFMGFFISWVVLNELTGDGDLSAIITVPLFIAYLIWGELLINKWVEGEAPKEMVTSPSCNFDRQAQSHTVYHKTPCNHCFNRIEYPSQSEGMATQCPHCGQLTVLRAVRVSQ